MYKVIIAGAAFFVFAATWANAATEPSPCKGLDNAGCTKVAACGWVKSFKTKKGKVINAYCRKKPTPKAKA